ncbi:hypothetical protein DFO83_1096 [Idiomarina loihiensis]|uniref:hypothetical protein n=1 Tax=Idiomarina TaxID=135575 RepID=UPI000D70D819|nr:hypothetical protein [Idiomarina]PWW35226.1 hypothetical protein DFO83_1096 [Idiomarina loihiensis]TDP45166.1 hypothetical protein DET58_1096 [Idiomarina loihiensis]TDS21113.1 hypothetical protein DET62_109126 [Idiomarina sp. H2]
MSIDRFYSVSELKEFFSTGGNPLFDAEFSVQTQQIVDDLGAKGAHLNKWWVSTAMGWECPSCRRKKPQIAKLDSRGYASCQLHEHHDHMKDIVRTMFEEASSVKEHVVANELAERFAIRTSYAISAYDNTVICSDCNKADGLAKIKCNAHQNFSFSPSEIAHFVKPKANQEHELDIQAASVIWQKNIDIFSKRMKLAKYIAELAASNSHWYQPSKPTAKQTERTAAFLFNRCGLNALHWEPEKLLYNTMPFKGHHSSWRERIKPQIKSKPSKGQIAHLSNTRGRSWVSYSEDWTCPCCERCKYDCLKPSKKNPWVFEVKTIRTHSNERDSYIYDIKVCNECFNAANHLGREAIEEVKEKMPSVDVYYPHNLVSFDELKSVISPRAHSSHIIDNTLADKIVVLAIKRIIDENYYCSPKHKAVLAGKE